MLRLKQDHCFGNNVFNMSVGDDIYGFSDLNCSHEPSNIHEISSYKL